MPLRNITDEDVADIPRIQELCRGSYRPPEISALEALISRLTLAFEIRASLVKDPESPRLVTEATVIAGLKRDREDLYNLWIDGRL